MVEPLTYTPNVVANITAWPSGSTPTRRGGSRHHLVGLRRGVRPRLVAPRVQRDEHDDLKPLPTVKVSHVQVGLQSISFHVSRVGVPMLVKISYYPRWM